MDNFESLRLEGYGQVDDYLSRFYKDNGEILVAPANEILADTLLPEIENIKNMDEFNEYAVGWFEDDDDETGDVVVSVYSLDERPAAGGKFTPDNIYLKVMGNDAVAEDIIIRALKLKLNMLLQPKTSPKKKSVVSKASAAKLEKMKDFIKELYESFTWIGSTDWTVLDDYGVYDPEDYAAARLREFADDIDDFYNIYGDDLSGFSEVEFKQYAIEALTEFLK